MGNKKAEESFINCANLYAHYKHLDLNVRQARLIGDEVVAEPIDFCADVDLKIRRALGTGSRTAVLVERLCQAGKAELVPQADRVKVGQAFIAAALEEAYRMLFWKANQTLRRVDAEDSKHTTDAEQEDSSLTHTLSDDVSDETVAEIFSTATSFFGQ